MKYQIIRMKNGKQQHLNLDGNLFLTSVDRWDGMFEASPEEAAAKIAAARCVSRVTSQVTAPALHKVIG